MRTAFTAAVGDVHIFKNGRRRAAWLGWYCNRPPQADVQCYWGSLNAAFPIDAVTYAKGDVRGVGRGHKGRCTQPLDQRRAGRRGVKIAAVEVATKKTRIGWALLAKGRSYCAARYETKVDNDSRLTVHGETIAPRSSGRQAGSTLI